METVIEQWEKEIQADEKAINNSTLLKEEKVSKVASARAQMINRARVLLSNFERGLLVQQGKLEDHLSQRILKPVYTMTEIGQLNRLNDLFQSFLFKAEIKNP